MANVTLLLIVAPATALGGTLTVANTSASGEIAVVCVSLSGLAFAPWLVDVPMVPATATEPVGGAVKLRANVMPDPAPRLVGMPLKVTAPDAGS